MACLHGVELPLQRLLCLLLRPLQRCTVLHRHQVVLQRAQLSVSLHMLPRAAASNDDSGQHWYASVSAAVPPAPAAATSNAALRSAQQMLRRSCECQALASEVLQLSPSHCRCNS